MNFVTLDFETAQYARESACSIGMVKYRDGKAVETFYSLIRPPKLYIRPDFTEIHGLTVEDVQDAPPFGDLWDGRIKPFIEDLPLAAHNAPFDMGALKAVLEWYALPVPAIPYFCSLSLSRRTWPGLRSYALTALAAHFGISYDAHNALSDAETCGDIVLRAGEQRKSSNLTSLLVNTGIRMGLL